MTTFKCIRIDVRETNDKKMYQNKNQTPLVCKKTNQINVLQTFKRLKVNYFIARFKVWRNLKLEHKLLNVKYSSIQMKFLNSDTKSTQKIYHSSKQKKTKHKSRSPVTTEREGVVLLPGSPAGRSVLVVSVTLSTKTTILLSLWGEPSELSVLVHWVADPDDPWIISDGIVCRVHKNNLVVRVSRVLSKWKTTIINQPDTYIIISATWTKQLSVHIYTCQRVTVQFLLLDSNNATVDSKRGFVA